MPKRLFDICISLVGLMVTLPVIATLALLIKLTSPGPICYLGRRVGLHGRPFHIFKFRSMVINAEKIGGSSTSDTDPRITRIGGIMRRYKLDELPQLFNVLLGQMSIVGPRPEVQQYVDQYSDEEKAILTARPGITDWASIMFSDEGGILRQYPDPDRAYEEVIRPIKLRLQLHYVHHRSLLVDGTIIWITFLKLVGKGELPREILAFAENSPAARHVAPAAASSGNIGYDTVTELPGHGATKEQMAMLHTRYQFASLLSQGKDVLELACGPGIGLDHLRRTSRRVVGGDFDPQLVRQAIAVHGSRLEIQQMDAQNLPFPDASFDVVLLLEAVYYIPDARRFVCEARRVLRPGGIVMICSANRERPDFNPSPFTYRYYSASELRQLMQAEGFGVSVYGAFPTGEKPPLARLIGLAHKVAVKLNLVPKTMKWKIALKRLIFGELEPIPAQLEVDETRCEMPIPLSGSTPATNYKVIYAVGRRAA